MTQIGSVLQSVFYQCIQIISQTSARSRSAVIILSTGQFTVVSGFCDVLALLDSKNLVVKHSLASSALSSLLTLSCVPLTHVQSSMTTVT